MREFDSSNQLLSLGFAPETNTKGKGHSACWDRMWAKRVQMSPRLATVCMHAGIECSGWLSVSDSWKCFEWSERLSKCNSLDIIKNQVT